jgi:hypothetical protein
MKSNISSNISMAETNTPQTRKIAGSSLAQDTERLSAAGKLLRENREAKVAAALIQANRKTGLFKKN